MSDNQLKSAFRYGMWAGGGAETVSGAGSTLAYTEGLRPRLEALIRDLGIRSVLDAPCGDFNWMSKVDLGGATYHGLDIVDKVIAQNAERFGGTSRNFAVADITSDQLPKADLMICRDLLLHLPFRNIFALFENLLRSDFDWILISSHVNTRNSELDRAGKARLVNLSVDPFRFPRPQEEHRIPDWVRGYPERYLHLYSGEVFREHARAALSRYAAARSSEDASEGDLAPRSGTGSTRAAPRVFRPGEWIAAENRPATLEEFSDSLPASVHEYSGEIADRKLLLDCLFTSLSVFGFFTRHAPRYWEYPEILSRVTCVRRETAVVDLGAGVSPLPVLLARAGLRVVTVDYSKTQRDLSRPTSLNEWGFLDYSSIEPRIESHNVDFAEAPLGKGSAGLVYSVSVVEHMPAEIRRKVFARVSDILVPGGRMVLTLDLEPHGHALWNRDRGKIVEPAELHGDLDDVLTELRDAGMKIADLVLRRRLPGAATDIALLEAVRATDLSSGK